MKVEQISPDLVTILPLAKHSFKDNTFLRLTKDDGEILVIAIPEFAFTSPESPYAYQPSGLNLVFAGHYE